MYVINLQFLFCLFRALKDDKTHLSGVFGKASFFIFSRSHPFGLVRICVSKRRCFAHEVASGERSVFVECRIFVNLPNKCKGLTAAVQLAGHTNFFLAVVDSIYYQGECGGFVRLHIWKGPITHCGVPAFSFFDPSWQWPKIKDHFASVSVKFSHIREFYFLNQVSGKRPFGQTLFSDVVNAIDGKAQCSVFGPDHFFPKYFRLPRDIFKSTSVPSSKASRPNPLPSLVFIPKKRRGGYFRKHSSRAGTPYFLRTTPNYWHLEQLTIYAECTPQRTFGRKRIPTRKGFLGLPFVTLPGCFANIWLSDYDSIVKPLYGRVGVAQYERVITELALSIDQYPVVDEAIYVSGVRVKIVQGTFFDSVIGQVDKSSNGIRTFRSTEKGPPMDYPGIMVSHWLRDAHMNSPEVKWDDILFLNKHLGNLYGSRGTSKCRGANVYIGKRKTTIARVSPVCGPGMTKHHHYFRNGRTRPLFQPRIQKFLNVLVANASSFGVRSDSTVQRFLPGGTGRSGGGLFRSCEKALYTMNFANEDHVDLNDLKRNTDQERWRSQLSGMLDQKDESARKKVRYLKDWIDLYGLGTPTTCVYQFVTGSSVCMPDIIQYFIMDGVGICVRLRSHVGHMFYGHSFRHRTAVPIFVCNGIVDSPSISNRFVVFAWGSN